MAAHGLRIELDNIFKEQVFQTGMLRLVFVMRELGYDFVDPLLRLKFTQKVADDFLSLPPETRLATPEIQRNFVSNAFLARDYVKLRGILDELLEYGHPVALDVWIILIYGLSRRIPAAAYTKVRFTFV